MAAYSEFTLSPEQVIDCPLELLRCVAASDFVSSFEACLQLLEHEGRKPVAVRVHLEIDGSPTEPSKDTAK